MNMIRTECYSNNILHFGREDSDSAKGIDYFSKQRNVIQKKGFRIKSIISSHIDALTAPDTGMRFFMLPDPVCYKFEQKIET